MVKSPPSNVSATATDFSCISLLLDHPRINPSTNKIFCLPWMSWNTTALRNYFVVLFKGYVLQLIPAHHDIYKSAFCKKATNLGEKRKHPEFKVILAVLLEICVCQRRKIWKAQGRGRAEELWSHSGPLLWDRWTDRSLRWPQATHAWGWLRSRLLLTSVSSCLPHAQREDSEHPPECCFVWAVAWGDFDEFCQMLWDAIATENQHFASLTKVSVGNEAVMSHHSRIYKLFRPL